MWYPYGIVVDARGNVFFSTYNTDTTGTATTNDRIRRLDGTTGVISTYVNSSGLRGYNGDGLSASSTQLFWPQGLALDSNGNLLVVDLENRRVRKVSH